MRRELLQIRITQEERELIRAAAASHELSVSEWVRSAVINVSKPGTPAAVWNDHVMTRQQELKPGDKPGLIILGAWEVQPEKQDEP